MLYPNEGTTVEETKTSGGVKDQSVKHSSGYLCISGLVIFKYIWVSYVSMQFSRCILFLFYYIQCLHQNIFMDRGIWSVSTKIKVEFFKLEVKKDCEKSKEIDEIPPRAFLLQTLTI